ncbi:hypothetical protein CWE34_16415 [Bacillus sp. SN10]|nr:hypothetical protein CWE34_16415 [Bacillus sp. SN10]
MLGAAAIGNASSLPKHNETTNLKNRQWGTKVPLPILITHIASITRITLQNFALHMLAQSRYYLISFLD